MADLILKQSGVYQIINTVNGKRYVGSSANISGRWRQHKHMLRSNKHKNQKLQNAWSKHGEGAFEFLVLEYCQESELIATEQRHIDSTGCVTGGYNISAQAGRERAGAKHSESSIQKMSEAHMGRVMSDESREKLSIAHKGRLFSEETKAKISAAKTGKKRAPFSDEARANMSAGMKGRVHSQECRAALSAAHKGKVMSDFARENMSIAQRKRFAK